MQYELDPSLLVRIWFSKDPNKAINLENKQRLINLRAENPDATISLVYAKKMLSENALERLFSFCKKYKITPISMEEDVIPFCLDEEEKNLVSIYQKEINYVHNGGGNLAAASDIARWLKPVYSRGIYSDFDTRIHPISLKEKITVEAPILLNIGSLEFPFTDLPKENDLETIVLNNDIIAVVGDDVLTSKLIKNIQCAIYKAYEDPETYSQYYYQLGLDVSKYVCQCMGAVEGFRVASNYMLTHADAILASQLFRKMADPVTLRKQLLEENESGDIAFCRRQVELLYPGLFSEEDDNTVKKAYVDFMSNSCGSAINETEITLQREAQFNKLYMATVIHASGPGRLILSLFGNAALPASEINKRVMPYSFHHYEKLNKVFSSANSYKAHTSYSAALKQAATEQIGVTNDQSWTELGERKAIEREKHIAVGIIQRFFRSHRKDSGLHQKVSPIEESTFSGDGLNL